MAEYIEREAVLCKNCIHNKVCFHREMINDIDEWIDEFGCDNYKPIADVVEVVRCKDCEHSEMCFPCKAFGLEALPVYVCRIGHRNREVLPNDYCSCGAKMDGVTDTNVGKMDGKGENNG